MSLLRLVCRECEYDLSGVARNVCPECATRFDAGADGLRPMPGWLALARGTSGMMLAAAAGFLLLVLTGTRWPVFLWSSVILVPAWIAAGVIYPPAYGAMVSVQCAPRRRRKRVAMGIALGGLLLNAAVTVLVMALAIGIIVGMEL